MCNELCDGKFELYKWITMFIGIYYEIYVQYGSYVPVCVYSTKFEERFIVSNYLHHFLLKENKINKLCWFCHSQKEKTNHTKGKKLEICENQIWRSSEVIISKENFSTKIDIYE